MKRGKGNRKERCENRELALHVNLHCSDHSKQVVYNYNSLSQYSTVDSSSSTFAPSSSIILHFDWISPHRSPTSHTATDKFTRGTCEVNLILNGRKGDSLVTSNQTPREIDREHLLHSSEESLRGPKLRQVRVVSPQRSGQERVTPSVRFFLFLALASYSFAFARKFRSGMLR